LTDSDDIGAIRATVQKYFDGMYRSDVKQQEQAFHPSAMVIGYASDGTLAEMSRGGFLTFVAGVPAPADNDVPYDMEVVSVDRVASAASVKVRDLYLNRMFTDYLHLLKGEDGWQIVAKTFHSDPLD